MLKTLLKKQISELVAGLLHKNDTKKGGSLKNVFLYGAIYIYLVLVFGWMFFLISLELCKPLYEQGLSWLYFALMGIVATLLGIVGGVLTAHAALYQAKDNELLLSMPIPAATLLASRIILVYLTSFFIEAVVLIPMSVVYFLVVECSGLVLVGNVGILLLLPLVSVSFSCALGWVIAWITSKVRHKTAITVIISIGYLGACYYLFAQLYMRLQMVLIDMEEVGVKVRTFLYPFYQMGMAGQGNMLSMLLFAAIVTGVFCVVYCVLAKSFIRLITTRKSTVKVKYQEKALKESTLTGALLRREFMRFGSCATYMLNCGLGSLILLIITAFVIVKGEWLNDAMALFFPEALGKVPLLICAVVACIASMNSITAPSISLEGKTLWLIRSLPVASWQILEAKILLHMLVTGIPVYVCSMALVLVCKEANMSILSGVLVPLCSELYVFCCAMIGLMLNLLLPNFDWTNESVPVKQDLSVILAILIPWVFLVLLGASYFVFGAFLSVEIYLLFVMILLGAVSIILLRILKTKGVKMFETL